MVIGKREVESFEIDHRNNLQQEFQKSNKEDYWEFVKNEYISYIDLLQTRSSKFEGQL